MKIRMGACAGLLLLMASACDPVGPERADEALEALPRELSVAERAVIRASNDFAWALAREVDAVAAEENFFISPLSVSMALGMTMNGAAGETHAELKNALGFPGLSQTEINDSYRDLTRLLFELDPSVSIGVANSIWYRLGFPFEETFFDIVGSAFDAHVEELDFSSPAAPGQVNEWVADATRGRIDSMITSVSPQDVMYLLNAIYFKGEWRQRFDRAATREEGFRRPDDSIVQVPMMSTSANVRSTWTPQFQAVDLPYGNGAFTMTIIVPHDVATVGGLIAGMDGSTWDGVVGSFTEPAELQVVIPRFGLEFETGLNEVLQTIGIRRAFVPGEADFTGMSVAEGRNLYISRVHHKTFVEVDEEGTEAAAATSVTIGVTSMPATFRADRPFLFVIRERFSGTILFLGRMNDPTARG